MPKWKDIKLAYARYSAVASVAIRNPTARLLIFAMVYISCFIGVKSSFLKLIFIVIILSCVLRMARYLIIFILVLVHIFIPFLFLINQGILTGIAVIMQIHALYQMLDQALPHIVANAMATAAAPKPPPIGATLDQIKRHSQNLSYVEDPDIPEQERERCTVCLCEFETGDELRSLNCTHMFHTECIDPWLQQNKKCPLCRLDMDKNGWWLEFRGVAKRRDWQQLLLRPLMTLW